MREQLKALGVSGSKIYLEIDSVASYVNRSFDFKLNDKIEHMCNAPLI